MPLPSPGRDPVADHTWCCEHPEPWRYFRPEAEARLLSGLERIYRVDPVETAWTLRIMEWTASPAAVPILEKVARAESLPPKRRKEAGQLLRSLKGETRETTSPLSLSSADPAELLAVLSATRSPETRRALAEALADRFPKEENSDMRLQIVCELLGERHPHRADLLDQALHGDQRLRMSQEARTRLLLACATAEDDRVLAHMIDLLTHPGARFDPYDVYEAIKALVRTSTPAFDATARTNLLHRLREQRWWRAHNAEERGQLRVIEAALAGIAPPRWPAWGWDRAIAIRHATEALGHVGGRSSIRRLSRLLCSPILSVRREAARSLQWIGDIETARVLLAHVRDEVLPGRIPYDIEGVATVAATLDASVAHGLPDAPNVIATLMATPEMRAHDIPERCALALCLLDDPRCMEIHAQSGLPALVHALLSPLPIRAPSPLAHPLSHAARWLQERFAVDLPIPADDDPSHGPRVVLSRALLDWWDTREPGN